MTNPDLITLLACPRCDNRVIDEGETLKCAGCETVFPKLDGIPFLFADPSTTLDAWRQRYHARIRELEHETSGLEAALAEPDLPQRAVERMQLVRTANAAHVNELNSILAPLDTASLTANHQTYLALRTRLPSDQGISTYYANLHRDWCWGDEENAESLRLVREGLGDHEPAKLLVLGAGGSRLAYDLHRSLPGALTVACDFNPLLLLTAARLLRGEPVTLHEFPMAPRSMQDTAREQVLEAPAAAGKNLSLVLASALRAPFKNAAFDTLITPWLVDILPESLSLQARRWNRLLAEGGSWVWFGSHAFSGAAPRDRISLEESLEIIEASGFSRPEVIEAEIPYMVSPADRLGRNERVVVINARKVKSVKAPPRHVALPDWLVKSDQPVPATPAFQTEIMSNRILAHMMSLIDGQRSIDDMAQILEDQRLMVREEAVASIRTLLIRMFEDAQQDPGG